MSEPIRPEHAERVRDFYRNQGAAKQQQGIAEILADYRNTFYSSGLTTTVAFDEMVEDLAQMFAKDNDRFIRSKFIDACLGGETK